MIQTDTYLQIGSSHQICEDYIISGQSFIILSDGCSSSKNTDMGARILCHLAKQYLLYRKDDQLFPFLDYEQMGSWIIHNAEMTTKHLGLHRSCLNATLIIAYIFDGNYHIYMYGDGLFALQTKDEKIRLCEVEYSKNAPYYLTYRISPADMVEYHNLQQDLSVDVGFNEDSMSKEKYAYDYETKWFFPCSLYPRLLIASDGLSSYMQQKINPIKAEEIVPEFFAYKSTKGEFLKRRLKRASKIHDQNDIEHLDDLSVGVFLNEE